MINGKTVLCVVPARGGSKGIKLKNLRQICGFSLVEHVGHVLNSLPFIDRKMVSTDHEGIANHAEQVGIAAPFFRPHELSGDFVGDWDVLNHALSKVEKIDQVTYDIIVMLQPTSPLRKASHVKDAVELFFEGGYDAVWSVSLTDSKNHPMKQLLFDGDTLQYYASDGKHVKARQQLPPIYQRNGVVYVMSRDCILKHKNIQGERCGALVLRDDFVSIDTEFDIRLAEFLMRESADFPSFS